MWILRIHTEVAAGYRRPMTTPADPTDPQLPEETSKRELPFDKEDLTFAPDDVVENSDADPDAQDAPGAQDGQDEVVDETP